MRCPALLFATLLLTATSLSAQNRADAPPPVPDARPPALEIIDESVEPQVTIRKKGDNTVSEYRIKGKLYMMKVTPAHGRPYVLIDHRGDGQFARQDNLDSGLRVPQWVLLEF